MQQKRYFTPILFRFIKRVLAIFLDIVFLFTFLGAIVFVSGQQPQISMICSIVFILYFPVMHAKYGQTLGKRFFCIDVVDKGTFKPVKDNAFWRMVLRDLIGRFISHAVFGLGYLIALLTYNGEALHDIIAGTVVMEKKK